jgi:hypothetical protein
MREGADRRRLNGVAAGLAIALAGAALLAGCGSTTSSSGTSRSSGSQHAAPTPTPSVAPSLSSGWLGSVPDFLTEMFIQLTQSGLHLQGTITEVAVTYSATLSTTAYPFTATVSGSTIAFDVQDATTPYWTGQLQTSGQMALQFNDSKGPVTTTLSPSSIAALDATESSEQAILDGNVSGSCSVNYPGHDAVVTLVGPQPDGNSASADCATAVAEGYLADNDPDLSGDTGVCVEGAWGSWADIVEDSGGQAIGTQICAWITQDGGPSPTFLSMPATFY